MTTSKIILILLSTGEAFIVDLRKGHAGRFELYDQHEGDDQRYMFIHAVVRSPC